MNTTPASTRRLRTLAPGAPGHRSPGLRALAMAAVAIGAGALPAAAQDPPAPPPREGTPPASGGPAKADDQSLLEGLVAKAIPKVEAARGMKFKSAIPVAPVTREQFVDRYMKDFERIMGGEDRVAPASRLLGRIGVLAEGTDIRAVLGKFLEGNIAANYDPQTGRVTFLPGAARSLQTMVHELTHAMDDQQFDMKAQMATWKGQFDRMLAYGALCEGDAESIEFRFMTNGAIANQPIQGLRDFADAMATAVLQGKFGATPPAIVLAFKSQYLEGAIFAETLRRGEAKEEAVNAAFRRPPDSTEQVLHPEKYIAGEGPVEVALPAAPEGAKVLLATTLGELNARIVLLTHGLKKEEAAAAAAGWGGDTIALVQSGGGEALVWVSFWDTEKDATEFAEAMNRAFPVKTGEESAKSSRLLVQRGTKVEYVEAPLDALPDGVAMAKGAEIGKGAEKK